MFCSNCGNQVPDNAAFCDSCGSALNGEEPVVTEAPVQAAVATEVPVQTPVRTSVQPAFDNTPTFNAAPASGPSASSVLVKGIVALACALSFYGSIVGIVFGCLAGSAAKRFMNANGGQLFGQAKIGRILGKVGLILGIVMTVFFVIFIIVELVTDYFNYYSYSYYM